MRCRSLAPPLHKVVAVRNLVLWGKAAAVERRLEPDRPAPAWALAARMQAAVFGLLARRVPARRCIAELQ